MDGESLLTEWELCSPVFVTADKLIPILSKATRGHAPLFDRVGTLFTRFTADKCYKRIAATLLKYRLNDFLRCTHQKSPMGDLGGFRGIYKIKDLKKNANFYLK